MKETKAAVAAKKAKTRHIGIDLGKRTYEAAIVERNGKATMTNGKTGTTARQALYKKLRPADMVALEAGNMAFIMAKEIEAAVGCRVFVLNPSRLAIIYRSMKKTDKEDALKLAHILEDFREERLPTVPVPSDEEMLRRKILSSSRAASGERTRAINRLHSLFVSQGITSIRKKDIATDRSRRLAVESLSGHEREEAEYLLEILVLCEKRLEALNSKMSELLSGDEVAKRLREVPGVGPKVAFAFLAHVAAERFLTASQVSNYLGLVPRVYMSGETVRYGGITKRGNVYVRALLVQASWALVRSKNGGKLKERYEYMTKTNGLAKKKSIVAVARRLSELMYAMMRDGARYEVRPFSASRLLGEELACKAMVA